MESIPYVYRLTDKTNGKRYIGSRYARGCCPGDLGATYFTSSRIVSPLFKADPARFEKQVLATGSVEYVIAVEKTLLDMYDAVMSEEFYNRANGKAIHPEDSRSASVKRWSEPAMRERITTKIKSAWAKPEVRSRMIAAIKSAMARPAVRARQLEVAKATGASLESKAKKSALMKDAWKRPESRERMLAAQRDPENHAKKVAGIKLGWANPESRSKQSVIQKDLWQDPNHRERVLEARADPAVREKLRANGVKGSANTNSQKWRCCECGLTMPSGALGTHQKHTGHVGRERLE